MFPTDNFRCLQSTICREAVGSSVCRGSTLLFIPGFPITSPSTGAEVSWYNFKFSNEKSCPSKRWEWRDLQRRHLGRQLSQEQIDGGVYQCIPGPHDNVLAVRNVPTTIGQKQHQPIPFWRGDLMWDTSWTATQAKCSMPTTTSNENIIMTITTSTFQVRCTCPVRLPRHRYVCKLDDLNSLFADNKGPGTPCLCIWVQLLISYNTEDQQAPETDPVPLFFGPPIPKLFSNYRGKQ